MTPVGTILGSPNVTFGASWLGIIDEDAGGSGNFANEPTPDTIAFHLDPVDPVDFDAGVQFVEVFYSAAAASIPLTLTAWDGPGGTGNVVDTGVGNTVGTSYDGAPCTGDPTGDYCLWDFIQLTSTTNNILSVTFAGGVANYYGLDNMTFCTEIPATGACCLDDDCILTTEANCLSLNGSYQGDDTVCTEPEACCLPDGSCVMLDPLCCLDEGGTPQGPGTVCTEPEACCLPNGSCVMLDPLCCDDQGGEPKGLGTVCLGMQACCFPDGSCQDMDAICCENEGGEPKGPGTVCLGMQACCFPNGSCLDMDAICCENQGGEPKGPGTQCLGMQACCFPDGSCLNMDAICCENEGGEPKGPGTVCLGMEACCFPDGSCLDMDAICCENLGGTPQGSGSVCSGTTIACCLQNGSGDCVDVDPLCCDDLGGIPSPIGEPACLGDLDGNGVDDACEEEEHDIVPTVSEWGLAAMALVLLAAAKVYFGRRRAARA